MYFNLFIVGSELNVAIFSCNLFEYKHVTSSKLSKLGGSFDRNDIRVVAKQARVTVNVTLLSQLVMSFHNFFVSMWQKFSGIASTLWYK